MITFKHAAALATHLSECRGRGETIGFVPTMGALHDGHISLVANASNHCDRVVCSIFVNPTQFNDPNDFKKYPVTLEADMHRLARAEVDFLFIPGVEEIYPDGTGNLRTYDLGRLDSILEGEHRPGHFQGVCQVVHRLLSITQPDLLVMGRKDYQQCMVCRRLIESEGLETRLLTVDTVREANGLAMSSRNRRLSESGRDRAGEIHAVLADWKRSLGRLPVNEMEASGVARLEAGGFRVEYACLCDATSLEKVDEWDGERKVVGLVAAWLEGVRLIDNHPLN